MKEQEPSFPERLEQRARFWLDHIERSPRDIVLTGVEREIRLTLAQIDGLHGRLADTRLLFDSAESRLRLEMERMDTNQWWYDVHREQRWLDRRKLDGDHHGIAVEGVKATLTLEQRLDGLHERLLVLLGRAEVLGGTGR